MNGTNKPPAAAANMSTNNLEKTIQNWVELDNELKKLNEKSKDIRTRKNDVEDKIMTYVEDNDMNNSVVNIVDGKIKFCETKQTSPLTLGFLEKCLSEVIANQGQVKQIVDYIKSKRETKMVPEIKRYYN
jgi:predicted transcriptional regulator